MENILKGSIVPMSKAQIKAVLRDVSTYTIEKSLKNLMAQGVIEKIGDTKGARYRMKKS